MSVVKVERRERRPGWQVLWVTIDRPEAMNALSGEVLEGLASVIDELAEGAGATRALVVTGAGERAFSAGADLKERQGMSLDDTLRRLDLINGVFNAWSELPLPTIAAVNGVAFGGGLELALACDLRIAVETAQLGLTEVRLGILPGAGGTQRLPRLIGSARAKEMILLGRRVPAVRAAEIGLVHQVAPAGGLAAAVDLLLAELEGSAPISASRAKEAIDRGRDLPLEEALAVERVCYEATIASEDRLEGLRAFAEKRPPVYRGQ